MLTPTGYAIRSPFGAVAGIRHAVIGMGLVEENTPLYFDCGNDAGLAVAGLNFPGYAQYAPEPVEGSTNVAAFEFPLWVASQFASVDEVEAALGDVVIVDRPINREVPEFRCCTGSSAIPLVLVVEYTSDGMARLSTTTSMSFANQPGFAWHHENLRNYLNASSDFPEDTVLGRARLAPFGSGSLMRGIPGDYYSPSRFVRAAYVNAHYPEKASEEENVSRAFHTLQQVAMVERLRGHGLRASSRRPSTRGSSHPGRRRTTGTPTTLRRSAASRWPTTHRTERSSLSSRRGAETGGRRARQSNSARRLRRPSTVAAGER